MRREASGETVRIAARALRDACLARLEGTGGALGVTYTRSLGAPLPADMTELLEKIDAATQQCSH